MDEWIVLNEYNWPFWIAGLFALFEFFKWFWSAIEWVVSKFGIETKHMRNRRLIGERLTKTEQDIVEIKETAKSNVQMFLEHEKKVVGHFLEIKDEVVKQLDDLSYKFDQQRVQLESKLEEIDKDGKSRDCSLLRDRLIQTTRYFSQQRDENGHVHVNLTEWENINEMFQEYFKAHGNGAVKKIYDEDFSKWIIDMDKK